MTKELKAHVERIRKLSPKLNETTDQAARIVEQVEKFLGDECSVGISASAGFKRGTVIADDEYIRSWSALVYERISGKFRIGVAVETYRVDDRDEFVSDISREVTVWSSADRETKLAAFEKLPDLLEEIADKAEKATVNVAGAAKSAEAVLKALGSPAPAPADTIAADQAREFVDRAEHRIEAYRASAQKAELKRRGIM